MEGEAATVGNARKILADGGPRLGPDKFRHHQEIKGVPGQRHRPKCVEVEQGRQRDPRSQLLPSGSLGHTGSGVEKIEAAAPTCVPGQGGLRDLLYQTEVKSTSDLGAFRWPEPFN